MEHRQSRGISPVILFAIAALIVLSHIHAYGITFDEARIRLDALNLIAWCRGDASTDDVWFGVERPSPAKVLAAAGICLFGDTTAALRFFSALLYALAATGVYSAVRMPRGPFAGYAAFASLLIAPPFFAFSAQASNESVVSSLTLVMICLAATAMTKSQWLSVGVVGGIALGTKISAAATVLAVFIWAFCLGSSSPVSSESSGGMPIFSLWTGSSMKRASRGVLFRSFALGICLGFLATWPVLPLRFSALIEHIRFFADVTRPLTIFGGLVETPPWYFAPVWLAIGLSPLLVLFALFEIVRGRGPLNTLLALHLVIGLFFAILFHQYLREGLRHLLPMAVAVAVCGGLGSGRIVHMVGAKPRWKYIVAIALILPFIYSLLALHPTEAFYISEVFRRPLDAMHFELPGTSSGDVLTDNVISQLPAGTYAVIPGAHCDRALNFGSEDWRERAGIRASQKSGRSIKFVSAESSDYLLVLGSGMSLGKTLLSRSNFVYVSLMDNPLRLVRDTESFPEAPPDDELGDTPQRPPDDPVLPKS